jgi:hypothetical protein
VQRGSVGTGPASVTAISIDSAHVLGGGRESGDRETGGEGFAEAVAVKQEGESTMKKEKTKLQAYVSPIEQGRVIKRARNGYKQSLRALLGTDPDKLSNEKVEERNECIRYSAVLFLASNDILRELKKQNKQRWTSPLGEGEAYENCLIMEKIFKRYGVLEEFSER